MKNQPEQLQQSDVSKVATHHKTHKLAEIVGLNGSAYTVKLLNEGGSYANIMTGIAAVPSATFAVGELVWLYFDKPNANPIIEVCNNENAKQYGFCQSIPYELLYFGMIKG